MKCQTCPSEAVALNRCESCLEGLIENYACTEVEQGNQVMWLKRELTASRKEANDLRMLLM